MNKFESCGVGLTKIYELIRLLKRAISTGSTTFIEEVKRKLEEYRVFCGSPFSDEEIQQILGTLDKDDANFLRNAPASIIRCVENKDLEGATTILKGLESYANHKVQRNPEGFLAMIETAFSRNEEEPSTPIIRETSPLEKNFPHLAKLRLERRIPFLKYKEIREPIPTNEEIQQRLKKRGEEK